MTRGSNTLKCTCPAYPYPHRAGGGKCQTPNPVADKAEGKHPAATPDAKWNFFFKGPDDNDE